MPFQIEIPPHGHATVLDPALGEGMHSSIGPWEEANLLYVEQSDLGQRLIQPLSIPLVIYDVGLGIATNALASLHLFNQAKSCRALHIVSFENDVSALKFALEQKHHFPFLHGNESILETLLTKHHWEGESPSHAPVKWDLKEGDFRDQVLFAPPPELIYFDFYSPKSLPHLWGRSCFSLLKEAAQPLTSEGIGSQLFTYSCSTAVRTAMLLAGFHVGIGVSTGKKRETTVASTLLSDLKNPLGEEWIKRWRRSGNPLPLDCLNLPLTEAEKLIMRQLH